MPRTLRSAKFFFYSPRKKGRDKGKALMGINPLYEGGTENITLKDLNDFLKEKNIDPAKVPLYNFIVKVKVE
jgi:hypothetical protein